MNLSEMIVKGVTTVSRDWTKVQEQQKKSAARGARAYERIMRGCYKEPSIKEAVYEVMEEAYLKASGGGKLPANARQIMYAARPLVLQSIGKWFKKSSSFTQGCLQEFIQDNPETCRDWDVVFDARGHMAEPHTGRRFGLGTIEVRRYTGQWDNNVHEVSRTPSIELSTRFPTFGPAARYKYVLFVEKEGFDPHLEAARISNRYDIGVMSTKGMTVTAARTLVESLSMQGVTVLVLHDFDKSGFSILHSLRSNNQRFRFKTKPLVTDLGLRLEDVQAMNLQSEPVAYGGDKNPRHNLRENGATKEECDFLVNGATGGGWIGERVELNAMPTEQFIEWLEGKLQALGVAKILPSEDVLKVAWERANFTVAVQRKIQDLISGDGVADGEPMPPDLSEQIEQLLKDNQEMPWDEALAELVAADDKADRASAPAAKKTATGAARARNGTSTKKKGGKQ
jgi:hypothetical protein